MNRNDLVARYYDLSTINSASARAEMESILERLGNEYKEKPKDSWERMHGIWLTVAMPNDGYLPGELLRIIDTTTIALPDGTTGRCVICNKMSNNRRNIVLMMDKGIVVGGTQVTPGPIFS